MYASSHNSFADLMSMAKQNAAEARKKAANAHLLPTTGRPKKADPKQDKLSKGVALFLAKKAEEEKRRKEEEKVKRDKLLQLRQQDRKATNRVRKMLSMTKSANKSCVDDAKDCLNESVAAQGEIQPDEDDYGYTSNYADMMHKKMMEKYKAIPVKPAFPQDRNAPPVPKHQTLSKNGSGWRKNGTSNDYEDEKGHSSPEQDRYEEKSSNIKKPDKPSKPSRPPPPDYRVLLQMAQEKQFEPAPPISIVEKKGELDEFEFGRPMTAKEKKAYLVEKEMKDKLARRMADKNNNSSSSSSATVPSNDAKNGKMPSFKIPKARSSNDETLPPAIPPPKKPRVAEPESSSSSSKLIKETPKPAKSSEPIANGGSSKPSSTPNSKPNGARTSSSSSNGIPPRPAEKSQNRSNLSSSSSPPVSKSKGEPQRGKSSSASHQTKPDLKSDKIIQDRKELIKERPKYLHTFNDGKDRDVPRKQPLLSKDSNKPRPGSSRGVHPTNREEKSYDSRDKIRESPAQKPSQHDRPLKRREDIEPPSRLDVGRGPPPRKDMGPPPRRDMGPPPRRELPMKGHPRMRDDPPPRMRPPSHKPYRGRAVIDSDEEYDSEMDDFIDDSEVDMGNISEEISRIFKYDRRKYSTYDESDDECMESSVAEQLREEQRSLRIGIQEDLEDMAREEEEKRRMKMLKKRR